MVMGGEGNYQKQCSGCYMAGRGQEGYLILGFPSKRPDTKMPQACSQFKSTAGEEAQSSGQQSADASGKGSSRLMVFFGAIHRYDKCLLCFHLLKSKNIHNLVFTVSVLFCAIK